MQSLRTEIRRSGWFLILAITGFEMLVAYAAISVVLYFGGHPSW